MKKYVFTVESLVEETFLEDVEVEAESLEEAEEKAESLASGRFVAAYLNDEGGCY